MARPAAGAGRQAQVARLLLTALLAGGDGGSCANPGEPPGGPPDKAPPQIVRVVPESGTVVPDLKGDAVIQFNEVIDEMPGGGGGGGGGGGRGGGGGGGGASAVTGLARQVVLSPAAGEVKVSWHRSAIHVKPAEGWKRNRVYHLELLPGITDLRRNVMKKGATIVFATGPAPPQPSASLTGTALLWVEQRVLPGAVIRAAPIPDTVAYVTIADSAGDFRLAAIPPGRYLVWVIQDQNNNRQLDRREAFDSANVTVDSTASAVLFAFPHDSAGPRIKSVEPVDSLAMGVSFSQPLDPRRMPDTARVRVFVLPDTTPVPVKAVLAQADYDSIRAKAQAAADSLQRARDTTARKDTTARRAPAGARTPSARPPGPRRLPPPPPPSRAPAGRDTTAAAVDTTRIRQLLKQRPVPADRIVVQTATRLAPGAKYLVRVRGATNLNGATADAQGVLAVPALKPAPRDSGPARRDTTKSP